MTALLVTLAIQIVATLMALTPPVFATLAAPDFGVSPNAIGVFTALVFGTASVAAVPWSEPIIRRGAIRISQIGLILCAFGLALLATASIPLALIGTIVVGIGYAPITPASSHLLIRQTPPDRRALMFSIKQTGVPLGGMLAGAIVPPLALEFGWRGAAFAIAVAAVIIAIGSERQHRQLDDDADPNAVVETHLLAALRQIFTLSEIRPLAVASFVYSGMQNCVSAFLVTYLALEAGMSLVMAGIVMSAVQAAGIIARILWGFAADRYPPARLMIFLGVGIGIACVALAFVSATWSAAPIFLVAAAIGSTAYGWNGVFLAEVARLAPPGRAGALTGGVLAMAYLGAFVMPMLFGALVSVAGSYRPVFIFAALVTTTVGVTAFRRRPRSAQQLD